MTPNHNTVKPREPDPKAEVLVDYVRVEHPDIIVISHDPPETDCPQEELPW